MLSTTQAKGADDMSNAERFDDRVRALRYEAAMAGDMRMVAICDRALDCRDDYSTEEAREECARVMRAAEGGAALMPSNMHDTSERQR